VAYAAYSDSNLLFRGSEMRGKFFHTFVNSQWQYQGHVIREVSPGNLRVQLYSAVDGLPNGEKTIPISSCDWSFFDSTEEWRNKGQEMHDEYQAKFRKQ
jgi:hypothetical protein